MAIFVAISRAIADLIDDKDLKDDCIPPAMDDPRIPSAVMNAVRGFVW